MRHTMHCWELCSQSQLLAVYFSCTVCYSLSTHLLRLQRSLGWWHFIVSPAPVTEVGGSLPQAKDTLKRWWDPPAEAGLSYGLGLS